MILGDEGEGQSHSLKDVVFCLCTVFNQLELLVTSFQTILKTDLQHGKKKKKKPLQQNKSKIKAKEHFRIYGKNRSFYLLITIT